MQVNHVTQASNGNPEQGCCIRTCIYPEHPAHVTHNAHGADAPGTFHVPVSSPSPKRSGQLLVNKGKTQRLASHPGAVVARHSKAMLLHPGWMQCAVRPSGSHPDQCLHHPNADHSRRLPFFVIGLREADVHPPIVFGLVALTAGLHRLLCGCRQEIRSRQCVRVLQEGVCTGMCMDGEEVH